METIKQNVTLIINAKWIIPVDQTSSSDVLENHAIIINHKKIEAILPSGQATEKYSAEETVNLTNHTIIPGLINAHTHAAMSLFRGLADDLPLMQWLNEHIGPAEATGIREEFIREGALLALAAWMRAGPTWFEDW